MTTPTQRLDKLLVHRSALSRREANSLCRRGRVTVNGERVRDPSRHVPIDAEVCVYGQPISDPPRFVMYHKPEGVHTTMRDNHGRPDLSEVLPEPWRPHLHPVGRLDAQTTGLLLFCADGALTQWLLHPRRAIEREYIAHVSPTPDPHHLTTTLAAGVETTDGTVSAQVLDITGDRVRLVVREGKYHMVRRILANTGHPVQTLHRVRYGLCSLGDLATGELRVLRDDEVAWIGRGGAPAGEADEGDSAPTTE